jgi:hypothetical protein
MLQGPVPKALYLIEFELTFDTRDLRVSSNNKHVLTRDTDNNITKALRNTNEPHQI